MTKGPFVYRRRVRWGDADPALIVYTVRFLDYVMEAIEEWYREVLEIDWYQLTVDRGKGSPVVNLAFDFHAPLKPGDMVDVHVLVAELRRTTITFVFSGFCGGEKSFSGKLTTCFIDSTGERLKAEEIPPEYRLRIQAYSGFKVESTSA